MRVALVCPYSLDVPGGVGTHVLGLATWLAASGHAPTVIAPGTRPVAVAGGVDLVTLGPATPLPFNGSVARLAMAPRQARLALEATEGADVVHVHEPLTPGVAHAAARGAAPLVVTHHASFDVPAPLRVLLRVRARRLGNRVTLAVSESAARTCLAATGHEARVVPNAIQMPPAPRGDRPAGRRSRIGFLGRLDEPRKGFTTFREMARLAAGRGVEADFVAAGPGRVAPGPVRLEGEVADRWAFLADVDVLVAPNTGGESFGLVLVEALAAGCDVVASDLPGFRAVLDEAGCGTTAPPGDATALLDAVLSRMGAGDARRERHAAATRWGWDRVGPSIVAAYGAASGMA